ncbi:GIY-YIG nuclease family protein [Desulfosediminicola sp.]|uniref:GIY-YIG nuclease family protein n=1 Tax=Desulfosediminicola sp. TaxID=2886825 RepID=UPI003AF20384
MCEWFVYILKCSDDSLYTGVTTDLERRTKEHNSPSGGARYTRSRRPVELVYSERCNNRSMACSREYRIKQLTRAQKQLLIAQPPTASLP